MNIDAALRLTARVDGSNNIRALQGSLQQLNQATRLSKAELGQWNIEINRAARSSGNTIAGLRAHAAALTQLRERVEIGSRAYQRFSQQIDATNAKLRQATTLANSGGAAAAGGAGFLAGGAPGLVAGLTTAATTATGVGAINAGIDRTESERRLRSLTQGLDDYTRVQQLATDASRRFGISQTEANVSFAQLYARLRPVGIELADIASAYNGFNTAAKLSGASATEAQAAFLQLSQALGSGVLRGEELNSIFEQTPTIVQAIAREMNIPIGQLRKYAEQGKITSDIVLAALRRIETEGAGRLAESLNGPRQQVINLQNAFQDLQVEIGNALMPATVEVLRSLTQNIRGAVVEVELWGKAFQKLSNFLGPVVGQLGQIVGFLSSAGWQNFGRFRDWILGGEASATNRWGAGFGSNWNDMPGGAWPAGVPRPAGVGGGGGTVRPPAAATGGAGGSAPKFQLSSRGQALVQAARKLGVSPLDLAMIIEFESGGRPNVWGGTGGQYFGLIQFGPSERKTYGVRPGMSFEEQVLGPVVRFLEDRFRGVGRSTQGASLLDLYRTVLGGNPNANINGTDSFGTSPASGVARMSGLRGTVLSKYFGGSVDNVGVDAADMAQAMAQGYEYQRQQEELRRQGVASAKEALAAAEAQLEIQRETGDLQRLQLEYEEKKRALAVQYTALKAEAASAEEAELIDKRYHVEQANALVQYEQQRKQLLQEQRDLMDQIIEKAVELSYEFARGLPTLGNAAGGFMDGIDGWIEGIGTLRESVQQLTISGIGNLENALVELVTTGKTSFRQLAVSILQDTARMIIQQLVLANVLRMVQNLFGGFGGGGGLFGGLFADGGVFPSGLSFNPGAFAPGVVLNANGNAFGKGGIQPFAQGGVVTQPTLFQFAGGGAMRNGLMGEAGPEAIMPLRRGRDGKLGVMAGGGGTSVVVNVDASGTRAQGDSSRANMVGRELGAFVEQKILEMKRPGGLLAAT